MRKAIRTASAMLLTLAWVGCDVLAPEPSWSDRGRKLEEQRQIWADTGVDSYRYRVMRGCFCSGPVGTFRVTVTDGVVTAAESTYDGEPVPDDVLPLVPTVDSLFAVIEEAIGSEVDGLVVEYHSDLGYPTLIDIDWIERAIDDEVIYEAAGLEEL